LDDLPTIRMIVSGMLEDHGFSNFYQAGSAEIAMKILQSETVDFILADWNLPGKSGIEFLRWVRTHREMKTLPFVLMTSNNDPRQIALAKKLGASGYLVKPFGVNDLLEVIAECHDSGKRLGRLAV
jgi:two-component system, chemotaxis family, chemotaxis protein CheY